MCEKIQLAYGQMAYILGSMPVLSFERTLSSEVHKTEALAKDEQVLEELQPLSSDMKPKLGRIFPSPIS